MLRKGRQFLLYYYISDTGIQDVVLCSNSKKCLKIPKGQSKFVNRRKKERKKERQHNGQKKKDKQLSTKYTHKTEESVTRTPLKTGDEYYFNLTCFPLLQMLLSFMYFASILGHACMPRQQAKQDKLHSKLNSSRASSRIKSRMITPNHLSQGILSTDFTSTYNSSSVTHA